MKTLLRPMLLVSTLALAACANKADTNSNPAAVDAPAAVPASAADAAVPPAPPAATTGEAPRAEGEAMANMSAEQHAAMDAATNAHGSDHVATGAAATPSDSHAAGVQAGWYTAGTFRACGSTQAMKVDKPAEIDAQVKKGGMSAGDPVYVQLEGMAMGETYMLTRVAQVGSKTPVRDCPMTGTTTQAGG
jgi:hypothetical protein